MSRYEVDPNDSTKMIPKQTNAVNASSIAAFATDAAAQVSNPTAGTMTYSTASDKIFIYNGTAWKTFTRD
jgi:pyocin large subunit-like protein